MPELKKDELAEFLWPYLRDKLEAANASERFDEIPIVRQKAIELANISFRRHIGMQF